MGAGTYRPHVFHLIRTGNPEHCIKSTSPTDGAAVRSHPAASDCFSEDQPRWPTTEASSMEVDALETKAVKEVLLTIQMGVLGAVEVEVAVLRMEAEVQATAAKLCGTSQLS